MLGGGRVTTATPTLGHGPHRVSQSGRKTNLVFRLPQRNKFNNIFVFLRFVFYSIFFCHSLSCFSFYCALIENPLEFLQSRSEEGRQMQWDSSPSSPTPTTPCGPSESVTYLFRPVHTCSYCCGVDMKSVSYFRMQIHQRNFVYVDITSYSDVIYVNICRALPGNIPHKFAVFIVNK